MWTRNKHMDNWSKIWFVKKMFAGQKKYFVKKNVYFIFGINVQKYIHVYMEHAKSNLHKFIRLLITKSATNTPRSHHEASRNVFLKYSTIFICVRPQLWRLENKTFLSLKRRTPVPLTFIN